MFFCWLFHVKTWECVEKSSLHYNKLCLDPYYYSVGGNMETNRFEDYWESYDWSNNVNTAFINPNHEFTSEGTVKAFEAYITRMDGEYSCRCV